MFVFDLLQCINKFPAPTCPVYPSTRLGFTATRNFMCVLQTGGQTPAFRDNSPQFNPTSKWHKLWLSGRTDQPSLNQKSCQPLLAGLYSSPVTSGDYDVQIESCKS